MLGQTVGKYRILEEIGHGGMAAVYRAQDTKLLRDVAIKILHPHLLRQPEAVERFQREAVTVAKLHHPNIIEIYDYSGENSPYRFLVTELIDGLTLAAFVERYGPLPCELAACIGRELCQALDHAHRQGVIHRDLKPENVMIRRDGKIKLMDFGIARVLEGAHVTLTGAILGSPAFMSPEHVAGREVDHRSDLFSLGSILYYMATAEFPFNGRNPHEVLKKVAEGDRVPAQELAPAVSNAYARLLDRLLALEPERRFADAADLCRALEAVIAAGGVENPAEEVNRLFADPDTHLAQFRARLAERLFDRAEAARSSSPAAALQDYERLLAVDPGHPAARRRMEGLLARRKLERRLLRAGLVVLGGLLAAGMIWAFGVRTEERRAVEQATAPEPAPETPAPDETGPLSSEPGEATAPGEAGTVPARGTPSPERRTPSRPAARERPPDGRPADARPAPPVSGSLRVVTAPWADIWIDGRKAGSYPLDARRVFPLSGGTHRVELKNPGCEMLSEDVTIERDGQQVVLRRRLPVRPAYLRVVNGQGAMVFVDGTFRGATPLPRPLEVRWTEPVSSREVLVSLTKEGFRPENRRLTLQAGRTEQLELTLTSASGGATP